MNFLAAVIIALLQTAPLARADDVSAWLTRTQQRRRMESTLRYWNQADLSKLDARDRAWVNDRKANLRHALDSAPKPQLTFSAAEKIKLAFPSYDEWNRLTLARQRSKTALDSMRSADGSWEGATFLSPYLTAEYVLFLKVMGRLDDVTQAKATHYLLRIQKADGSFGSWDTGPSDPTITHAGMVALRMMGSVSAANRAQAWITEHHGEGKTLFTIRLLGAMLGTDSFPFDAKILDLDYLRSFPKLGIRSWASWIRSLAVPLLIVSGLHESRHLTPIQHHALKQLQGWLERITDPMGQLYISETTNIMGILAYRELMLHGYGNYDRQIEGGLAFIRKRLIEEDDEELRVKNPPSINWDTPNSLLGILGDSPSPDQIAPYRKSVQFLYQTQVLDTPGVWAERSPNVRPGGWSTVPENKFNPDTDGSAQVLVALRAVGNTDAQSVVQHLRAIRWLEGLQSVDGGWATFEKSLVPKKPGIMRAAFPLDEAMGLLKTPRWRLWKLLHQGLKFAFGLRHDMLLLMDYSFVDMTAHVVEALTGFGETREDPAIRRAMDFIRQDLGDHPVWFSRYGIDFFAGANAAIRGFLAAGEDMNDPVVTNALDWIEAHQNADGGFGQNFKSLSDFSQAGTSPISIPSATAHALLALVSGGRVFAPSAKRAAEYLVRSQQADGRWIENEPNSWAGGIYTVQYTELPQYLSTLALTRYQEALSDAQLDPKVGTTFYYSTAN